MISALVRSGHTYHDLVHVYSYERFTRCYYETERLNILERQERHNNAVVTASGFAGGDAINEHINKTTANLASAMTQIESALAGIGGKKAEVNNDTDAKLTAIMPPAEHRKRPKPILAGADSAGT